MALTITHRRVSAIADDPSHPEEIQPSDWGSTASVLPTHIVSGTIDPGDLDLSGVVPITRTVNGLPLSGNISITPTLLGLGLVENVALSAWAGSANLVTLGPLSSLRVGGVSPPAGVEGYFASASAADPRGLMSAQYSTDATGARFHLRKGRGTEAAPTTIVTGDVLGRVRFSGYDSATYLQSGSIDVVSTGTIAATRVPTYMAFSVATNAAPSVLTEVLRLTPTTTTTPVQIRIGDAGLVAVPSDLGGSPELTTNAMLYVGNAFNSGAIFIDQIGATAGAGLVTRHALGTTGAPADVTNALQLGYMDFRAYSGTKFWQCASVAAHVDGTFTTGQAPPSRLQFATNIAGGGSTYRMTLNAAGSLLINTTTVLSMATTAPLQVKGADNGWTACVHSAPGSGVAFGLRCHTTPITAGDYPFAISAGAGAGAFLFSINGLGNCNIGALTGNANAILDVQSTTKAFMPPRLTTTQRDAIASPTAGMVVYNSTTGKLNVRGAAGWEAVTSA